MILVFFVGNLSIVITHPGPHSLCQKIPLVPVFRGFSLRAYFLVFFTIVCLASKLLLFLTSCLVSFWALDLHDILLHAFRAFFFLLLCPPFHVALHATSEFSAAFHGAPRCFSVSSSAALNLSIFPSMRTIAFSIYRSFCYDIATPYRVLPVSATGSSLYFHTALL